MLNKTVWWCQEMDRAESLEYGPSHEMLMCLLRVGILVKSTVYL